METLLAIVIGALFAGGFFCLLRRSMMKVIIGIMLMSQATNLLVFTAGGVTQSSPVFAETATGVPPLGAADPIPQALVLTAIVIGFGLVVFSLALLMRAYRVMGQDDLNSFNQTDQIS